MQELLLTRSVLGKRPRASHGAGPDAMGSAIARLVSYPMPQLANLHAPAHTCASSHAIPDSLLPVCIFTSYWMIVSALILLYELQAQTTPVLETGSVLQCRSLMISAHTVP